MTNLAHDLFLDRTRQELSRATRYCLYLSLVVIDISDFAYMLAEHSRLGGSLTDSIYVPLAAGIRETVRSSDVVSSCDHQRIGILLMEVSGTGLATVAERVRGFTRDFLRGKLDLPQTSLVKVYTASFPGEVTSFSQLVSQFAKGRGTIH